MIDIQIPVAFRDLFTPKRYKVYYGGRGGGKCLKKGTKVINADGSLCKVEDIKTGDKLMGPDGTPRNVLSTSYGFDDLYRIRQTIGDDYVVNSDHQVSLRRSHYSPRYGRYPDKKDVINVPVKSLIKSSKKFKSVFFGYKSGFMDFDEQPISIDPYYLGLWLGDGRKSSTLVTTMDIEVVEYLDKYAERLGLYLNRYEEGKSKSSSYLIRAGNKGVPKYSNVLLNRLKYYKLLNNKHIPSQYKINSEEVRLHVLAGLIDSDGYLHNNSYDITQKSNKLIKDIKFLADSLGFRTKLKAKKHRCTNSHVPDHLNIYYQLNIGGDIDRIPVKLPRKKPVRINKNKDWLINTISVEKAGFGEYYGFSLDGDQLFLLEDFTVTHNSETFARAVLIMAVSGKIRVLCAREYQSSIKDSVKSLMDSLIDRYNLHHLFRSTRDEITSVTGSQIIFKGLKINPESIKSLHEISICWVEEANAVSQASIDLLIPSIRAENSEIWFSFNPALISDPVYDTFVENGLDREDAIIRKVGYRDNPFFPDVLQSEMEYLRKKDPEKYAHVWEGEPLRISDAIIYAGHYKIDRFEPPGPDQEIYYGLDFGFKHPTAMVRFWHDAKSRTIYIDREDYAHELSIDRLDAFVRNMIQDGKKWPIIADSARPELIHLLKSKGHNIRASAKGPDSVMSGIDFLKSHTIMVHERCKNLIYEFQTYSFKVDPKTDEVMPIIVKKNDDLCDALRYASELIRKANKYIIA